MIEAAIKKIKNEIEKEDNAYVKTIGEYLINLINTAGEEVAKKINAEDKSIMDSLKVMRKEAEKQKVNGMAVLTPDQGFGIVMEYYGIKTGIKTNDFDKTNATNVADKKSEGKLQMSLDDLI